MIDVAFTGRHRPAGSLSSRSWIEALEGRQLLAATTFTLDPLRSVVTASGSSDTPLGTIQLGQQGAGSLSTAYQGTLVADVNGTSISLDSSSSIVANNSGNWQPASPPPTPPTAPGSAPANYGAQVSIPFFGSAVVAIRGLSFSVAAPATDLQSDGTFQSSGERFTALSGQGDYYETFTRTSGTRAVSGTLEQDESASPSRYTIENGVPTLTIPIDIRLTFRVISQTEDDTEFRLRGQLVATAQSATVAGRHVFYNASVYDGNSVHTNEADDGAVAPDKQALLPDNMASSQNVINYSKGINGVMVDVANLPAAAQLTAADFDFRSGNTSDPQTWPAGPTPTNVDLRRGDGDNNSDRISLVWNGNAVKNQWLQVTVKATPNTGLTKPDVFYFGNLIGDAVDNTPAPVVNSADLLRVRNAVGSSGVTIQTSTDIDRNGSISSADLVVTRNNVGRSLRVFRAPASAALISSGRSLVFRTAPSFSIIDDWAAQSLKHDDLLGDAAAVS